jgi:hypothetical protein
MDRYDELEDLKGTHEERIREFLTHRGAAHLLDHGLFGMLCQAMNDAWDCGRHLGHEESQPDGGATARDFFPEDTI